MASSMLKHTGIITNTGKNVVVAFMSLPGDEDHALVIDTDALPDSFNDSLRRIVDSVEGQDSKNLADLLARRMSPDGSNTNLLQKFHESGRLQKVSVDQITMTPRRGVHWPLRDVLNAMKESEKDAPADLSDLDPETRSQVIAEMGKFNMHANNIEGRTVEGDKVEAANLIRMAELLESDANAKRQKAYQMDPSLNKRNVTKPTPEVITKAQAKEQTKKVAIEKETKSNVSKIVKTVSES